MAHFGKTNSGDQADIPGPYDGNFDVFTHSAAVLFLIVEDNRTQGQSRGVMAIASLLKLSRQRGHLIFLLKGALG
jgi:hypothetical protein